MGTLAEIESAVDALLRVEQETLLQHLERRLAIPAPASETTDASRPRRASWLGELREIRERNLTGHVGASLQQVMDELREDRI